MAPEAEWGTVDTAGKRVLLLVTGAGRSGTSTGTGALKYLGFKVPEPEVAKNHSNPRGFFETQWVVEAHKRLMAGAHIQSLDTEPEAAGEAVRRAAGKGFLRDLRVRLADLPGSENAFVVKDPRTVWAAPLWAEEATEAGFEVKYLTMLRHPAEVLGSRKQYYHGVNERSHQAALETSQLAGWINVNLVNEAQTRGADRAFVVYPDLLADWRATMRTVEKQLGVTFSYDLSSTEPHEVDSFIEPSLRRMRSTWEDSLTPEWLQVIADKTWDVLVRRANLEISEEEFASATDALRDEYASLYEACTAVTADRTRRATRAGRSKAVRGARDKAAQQKAQEGSGNSADGGLELRKIPAKALAAELRRRVKRRASRMVSGKS